VISCFLLVEEKSELVRSTGKTGKKTGNHSDAFCLEEKSGLLRSTGKAGQKPLIVLTPFTFAVSANP
jgi:hypothetical protein